ncbi:MAG: class I SAM-dependent methyltransferase [Deltaproteobacteria bacterium]|nr:class I SAM-dependent methyltransferase [Deltaproteobacteria bacterium]
MTVAAELLAYVKARHPRSWRGVEEARALDTARFDAYAELLLGWAIRALGDGAIARTVDAFVHFTSDVNLAQGRYEADGRYESSSYREVYEAVYADRATMDDYLWGVYLTNFLWVHHLEISAFYEARFVARLPERARLVELAPGHGGWGLLALHRRPGATLAGFDISPSSIDIARSLARAAGLADRASYELRDALTLPAAGDADACICNFLVEHLETPARLFEVIAGALAPGGRAFVSGALTAAQVDHIHEFRRESELVLLAEQAGLRVLETLSVGPARTLPGARHLPRSMSLLLQRRTREHW